MSVDGEKVSGPKVWVCIVDHKHGTNIYAHMTEEGVWEALAEYVRHWWHHEMQEGNEPPADRQQMISEYFEYVDEGFELEQHEIYP